MFSFIAVFALLTSVLTLAAPSEDRFDTHRTLPAVTIFATGGTIAGNSSSSTSQTNYMAGVLGIDILLNAVPQIRNISNVTGVQFSNVVSMNFNTSLALKLSQQISSVFANGSADGVVVTHGTDTLEETALFLDLTHNRAEPIVIVGAMRPATGLSADGPYSLLQAVSLAASDSARNRGVMIVMNDRIGSAFYATKTNTRSLDTFKAVEQDHLGLFLNEMPIFYYEPSRVTNKPYFNVLGLTQLPKVTILYAYQDMDVALLDDAVLRGAKGIVIASEGDGSVDDKWQELIQSLTYTDGIPVVLSTRTGLSYTADSGKAIAAGNYNPQKAKILLQLALNQYGPDVNKLKELFGTSLRRRRV